MRAIPYEFSLGPLTLHMYGIGLAITFWFGFRYMERRLRKQGYTTNWLATTFFWVVISAILGARVVHVLANLGYYLQHLVQIPAIWEGGLSSFGGLLFAIPTGLAIARKRCPELTLVKCMDIAAPVLVASWSLGRILGPQLMYRGGGYRTNAWYGMHYWGQQGRRVPVPIFQSLECLAIFGILIWIEHAVADRPEGFILAIAAGLWGLSRFTDEYFWLAQPHLGSKLVEAAGLTMSAIGFSAAAFLWLRRGSRHTANAEPIARNPLQGNHPPPEMSIEER
ncbi:MAG: prolipoprotein diacylglyceryl transferase [Acidimicrobiales bacterium]